MQTVVICGANRGIGLALTQCYHAAGDRVVALCRSASPQLREAGTTILEGVDVTEDKALAGLPGRLRDVGVDRIGVLVNNAGILSRQSLTDLGGADLGAMRRQFEVNALGPLRTSAALLDLMGEGSKIGIITSRMGSIADNTSGGQYGYRMSKAAVNIAGRSLAHDLAGRGVVVALIHPGYVRTDMTGGQGLIDPPQAAAGIANVIRSLSRETSGRFWHSDGSELPW